MSVKKHDRHESKVEFENAYFTIHDDAIRLIQNSFGGTKEKRIIFKDYLTVSSRKILADILDIGTEIRIANSIYPQSVEEHSERRIHQERAIGLCFDLLTKYQLIMHTVGTKDDKYVNETKHLLHEINCLKKWRTSDNKRFKF